MHLYLMAPALVRLPSGLQDQERTSKRRGKIPLDKEVVGLEEREEAVLCHVLWVAGRAKYDRCG